MMLLGFVEAAYTLSWFYHMEKTPINATIKDAFRPPFTFSASLVVSKAGPVHSPIIEI